MLFASFVVDPSAKPTRPFDVLGNLCKEVRPEQDSGGHLVGVPCYTGVARVKNLELEIENEKAFPQLVRRETLSAENEPSFTMVLRTVDIFVCGVVRIIWKCSFG